MNLITILKAAAIISGVALGIYTLLGWQQYNQVANSGLMIFQFAVDQLAIAKAQLVWQSMGAAALVTGGVLYPNPAAPSN